MDQGEGRRTEKHDTEEKESIKRTLFRSQNIAVQLIPLTVEKKLKILFKLNNPNTKLIN